MKGDYDILAIGVHPDDIELCAAGTILKHIEAGYKVGLLDLTQGELGTRGSGALRLKEAEAARIVFGIDQRHNAGLPDGFIQHEPETIKTIVKYIRHFKPKIILCNAISDRHPDHGRASKIISDACFYAGLRKIETTGLDAQPQAAWRPNAVYHYIQDRWIEPNLVIDISNHIEKKIETVMAYSSQFFDPESKEPVTPISGSDFIEFIRARARQTGRLIGAEYGEGFTVERAIGVKDLLKLV